MMASGRKSCSRWTKACRRSHRVATKGSARKAKVTAIIAAKVSRT